jgi:hypothetical protein
MSDLAIHGGGQARLAARGLGRLTFLVEPVPPFRLDLTVWALRRRASNAVDRWDGTIHRRVLVVNGQPLAGRATRESRPGTIPRKRRLGPGMLR